MDKASQALPGGSERSCISAREPKSQTHNTLGIPLDPIEAFDEWFKGTRGNENPVADVGSMERPGDEIHTAIEPALQASLLPDSSPGHSIDSDHPPALTPANAGWYRHRAEDLGDLAAELIHEGLDGTAYGQAMRAAHYGRVALSLYEQRAREWRVPGHPGNFL